MSKSRQRRQAFLWAEAFRKLVIFILDRCAMADFGSADCNKGGQAEQAQPKVRPAQPRSRGGAYRDRSEEHTSELQSLMRISYAVFCLKKKRRYYQEMKHKTLKH